MTHLADRTSKRIVSLCDGCALPDVMTGTCTAFVDPEWQWRNYDPETGEGACWGRCTSETEMVRRLEAMVAYGHNAAIKRELRGWRGTAKALRRGKAGGQ